MVQLLNIIKILLNITKIFWVTFIFPWQKKLAPFVKNARTEKVNSWYGKGHFPVWVLEEECETWGI